jgi:hypothetical protein
MYKFVMDKKLPHTNYNLLAIIGFLVFSLSFANYSNAASVNAEANGFAVKALKIETLQRPNFGVIQKPSSLVTAGISTTGAISGNAVFMDSSEVRAGQYKIGGSSSQTISIQARSNNTYSFIRFASISGAYGSTSFGMILGKSNLPAPGSGTILNVGAVLLISKDVEEGDYSPAFTITVNYD